ncbi:hypothetical protein HGRIS_002134 [Hohenbuehelia grisea]|uniref:Uncharacterized protein n=1 Tax=Hohenbuehelia grisea TaxID=104357 RepID=A0ABR3JKE7_9AGAR
MTTLFLLFSMFCTLVGIAAAAPIEARDVYVPPILYPKKGTVWAARSRHNVTWDVSSPPKQITNRFGSIMLRKNDLTAPSTSRPALSLAHHGPKQFLSVYIARGFDIKLGRYEITVPDALSGNDYQIVLFGDSGNFSPKFTITNDI